MQVFRCSFATCGHFYHPKCVARLLQNNDITAQRTLKHQIAAGERFICPAHRCAVCNQIENERAVDFQFAICRRCPKAYHRRCLPRQYIYFLFYSYILFIQSYYHLLLVISFDILFLFFFGNSIGVLSLHMKLVKMMMTMTTTPDRV